MENCVQIGLCHTSLYECSWKINNCKCTWSVHGYVHAQPGCGNTMQPPGVSHKPSYNSRTVLLSPPLKEKGFSPIFSLDEIVVQCTFTMMVDSAQILHNKDIKHMYSPSTNVIQFSHCILQWFSCIVDSYFSILFFYITLCGATAAWQVVLPPYSTRE